MTPMKWFFSFLKKYRGLMIIGILLTTAVSVLSVVNPYISGQIVDQVISGGRYDKLMPFIGWALGTQFESYITSIDHWIAFVLLFGGETRYIIETGFSSLGRMIQNFVDLSTFTDPLRTSNFPQNWTIYYWAYWMVWCVAAPFFIGSISRGRTVRQTILGGYIFGVGSTLTSFIVLGNYSMGMQVTGKADFIAQYLESGDLYGMIVSIIKTMPGAPVIMVVVLLTMIAFYATSFDSIALTASCYSYHTLRDGEQPNKVIQLMWCILLILLPIALLFAESSMNNLQSVSIVAAFPIGVVIVMIAVSFMKDAKKYMQNMEEKGQQEVDNVDNEK